MTEEEAGIKKGCFPINGSQFYIKRYYIQLLIHYGKASDEDVRDIFDEFMKIAIKTDAYITKTKISSIRRCYEPFLETTFEGQIIDNTGTITKLGTPYYEYVG